jgi:hypothetical protein
MTYITPLPMTTSVNVTWQLPSRTGLDLEQYENPVAESVSA